MSSTCPGLTKTPDALQEEQELCKSKHIDEALVLARLQVRGQIAFVRRKQDLQVWHMLCAQAKPSKACTKAACRSVLPLPASDSVNNGNVTHEQRSGISIECLVCGQLKTAQKKKKASILPDVQDKTSTSPAFIGQASPSRHSMSFLIAGRIRRLQDLVLLADTGSCAGNVSTVCGSQPVHLTADVLSSKSDKASCRNSAVHLL